MRPVWSVSVSTRCVAKGMGVGGRGESGDGVPVEGGAELQDETGERG